MKNKTILITGGTTGMGLATAQLLSAEGARVIVTGRNPETLAAAKKALPNAIVIASDSASLTDNLALGQLVRSHAEKLDGVFLNAGVGKFLPIEATTPQIYEEMFNVNVRGLYFQLQSLLPLLASPSTVVLTSSIAGELAMGGASVYSATKAAVISLGKTLAVELAPKGIRVNTLSPGPIQTPIFGKMGMTKEMQQGFEAHMASGSLLKRMGTSEEIAKLARFLLSDDSSFIIGENITIDGGVRHT